MGNQGLLVAWLRVTAFWVACIVLFSDVTGFVYLSFSLVWSLGIALFSTVVGGVCYFGYRRFIVDAGISGEIEQTSNRGCQVSIGSLPDHPGPNLGGYDTSAFDRVMDFKGYAKRYPAYAALMVAGARVMMTVPGLPASPVRGGHGGATLFEHSLNVVKAMGKEARTWKFHGHTNKDGSFWHQVKGENGLDYHSFSMSDPILPLTAFLHDIGKVVCYQLQKDGSVIERTRTAFQFEGSILDRDKSKRVKIEHDTEGARLLRRMPELWALPREDVSALLLAVGYYHKLGSLQASEWISDRARSLVELLAHADNVAGQEEGAMGGHPLDPETSAPQIQSSAPAAELPSPPVQEAVPARTEPAMPIAPDYGASDEPDPQELAIRKLDTFEAIFASTPSEKKGRGGKAANAKKPESETPIVETPEIDDGHPSAFEVSDNDPEMLTSGEFELFLDILLQENRINGKDARERIGFKHGGWLYIADASLRLAMAKEYSEPSYAKNTEGVMHPWTKRLLKRLDAMGLLKKDLDGMEFLYRSALFTTVSVTPGHENREVKFVMIIRSSVLGSMERIPDCKTPPKVTKCTFGNTRAINKDKLAKPSSEVVEAQPAISVQTVAEPLSSGVEAPTEDAMTNSFVPEIHNVNDPPFELELSPEFGDQAVVTDAFEFDDEFDGKPTRDDFESLDENEVGVEESDAGGSRDVGAAPEIHAAEVAANQIGIISGAGDSPAESNLPEENQADVSSYDLVGGVSDYALSNPAGLDEGGVGKGGEGRLDSVSDTPTASPEIEHNVREENHDSCKKYIPSDYAESVNSIPETALHAHDAGLEFDLDLVLREIASGVRVGPQPATKLDRPGGKQVFFFELSKTLDYYNLGGEVAENLDIRDGGSSGQKYIRIEI